MRLNKIWDRREEAEICGALRLNPGGRRAGETSPSWRWGRSSAVAVCICTTLMRFFLCVCVERNLWEVNGSWHGFYYVLVQCEYIYQIMGFRVKIHLVFPFPAEKVKEMQIHGKLVYLLSLFSSLSVVLLVVFVLWAFVSAHPSIILLWVCNDPPLWSDVIILW